MYNYYDNDHHPDHKINENETIERYRIAAKKGLYKALDCLQRIIKIEKMKLGQQVDNGAVESETRFPYHSDPNQRRIDF